MSDRAVLVRAGSALTKAASFLIEAGAHNIYACATHAIFSDDAVQRLVQSCICNVVVTDTLPVPSVPLLDKLTVLPVSPPLARVIDRIHRGESVSAVYHEQQ